MGFLLMESPLGLLGLLGETALERIILPGQPMPRLAVHGNPLLEETQRQLEAYFNGTLTQFNLPLALEGTQFQREVWGALAEIPYGEICTYGDIARSIGRPQACRAVGQANHCNPLPIVIPCHRVVGARGLTGYGGGLETKAWLLNHEGIPCESSK